MSSLLPNTRTTAGGTGRITEAGSTGDGFVLRKGKVLTVSAFICCPPPQGLLICTGSATNTR
ncbi:MAG: hypothetical protein ACYS83_03020, partial [Planctomycetota bacterium]